MQLTVRDVAKLFEVAEKTVNRWVREGSLPAARVSDQLRFNRSQLFEWATARKIPIPAGLFADEDQPGTTAAVSVALEAGGIHHGLRGADKTTVLREVVNRISFPRDSDRDLFLGVLLAREELASTGVGDGIAIPHVRNPVVLNITDPVITLCFLDEPVDFGAMDGKPVHCLFTLLSPTVRAHLNLISRLAYALRDPGFLQAVTSHAPADAIMAEVRRVEAALHP